MIELSLILIPICSAANRARGSQFFNLIPSTVLARLASMAIIALAITVVTGNLILFPMALAGLMLWSTPAWDSLWSSQLYGKPYSKLKGSLLMFVRQLLILPTFAAVAYVFHGNYAYCAIACILWLPYLIFGAINPSNAVQRSEYTIGALIGLTFAGILCL